MKYRIAIIGAIGLGIVMVLLFRTCEAPLGKGEKVYQTHCQGCHGENGQSELKQVIPPINDPDVLKAFKNRFACIVVNGIHEPIEVNGITYTEKMPGNAQLTEIQVVNLYDYVYGMWSKSSQNITLKEVALQLENCE